MRGAGSVALSSVAEHMLSLHKALGVNPQLKKKKKNQEKNQPIDPNILNRMLAH
jgi:hypothetical protein